MREKDIFIFVDINPAKTNHVIKNVISGKKIFWKKIAEMQKTYL